MRWSFYILPVLAACAAGHDTPDLQVVLDEAPEALTNQPRATVAFHVDGSAAQVTCALDGAAPEACSSPFTADAADGPHTLTITATGAAHQAATTSHAWTVDTAPPDTAIVAVPAAFDPQGPPGVQFTGGPDVDHFECALDGAPFARCSSPVSPELSDGSHTFLVRAVDAAGNADPTPAATTWTIDERAPAVTITDGPQGPVATTQVTFAFSTPGKAREVTCALDDGGFAPCSSPFTTPELAQGPHAFTVHVNDVNGRTAAVTREFVVDTIGPIITITRGPEGPSSEAQPAWSFVVTGEPAFVQCRIDSSAWADCASGAFTAGPLANGPHRFELRAADALGNLGTASRSIEIDASTCEPGTSGCGVCGDGAAQTREACDGDDLRGASCASLGHAPGALTCAADCTGYDTRGCTGGYVPANTGFAGRPCFDGLRFSTPQLSAPYALLCTEDRGLYKTTLGASPTWTSVTPGGITNPHGRAVAVNPSGPPVYFVADASSPYNAFRSSTFGDTWTAQSIAGADAPRDLFAIVFRSQVGNIAGSWDAQQGAIVLHGSAPNLVPHFVGPSPGSVTGTVRAIASGGPKDVYVAVHGQTPSGAPATGGIFRACDLTATGGGTYVERDTGIAPDDRARVWSITVDPASVVTTPFQCGLSTSSGSATTYYAALRGGGQIYKTSDGGLTWSRSNAGLAPGAEVYAIAIHCFSGYAAPTCQDHNLLYAATSAGLYRSGDAGLHWTLDGFEGQVVRAIALDPSANPPRRLVAVDDAVGIYQSP